MKVNKYILSEGKLIRKENTIYFVNKTINKPLPIEKIDTLYCFGSVSVSSAVLNLFNKYGICIHFFGKYENYIGSFYPKKRTISGKVIIDQAKHYLDNEKRMILAKDFVLGSYYNLAKNVNISKKYENHIQDSKSIKDLLSVEGNMRKEYYSLLSKKFKNFSFTKRVKRPPDNEINALISFGNSLLYATIISNLYKTQLDPTISYLHEPNERRFSLALDISEIFKPAYIDRLILELVNKKIISEKHFDKTFNCCILNEKGKKIFLEHYDSMLKRTIKYKKLNKKVSYQRLILLECYKIQKHILNLEKYKPFIRWW